MADLDFDTMTDREAELLVQGHIARRGEVAIDWDHTTIGEWTKDTVYAFAGPLPADLVDHLGLKPVLDEKTAEARQSYLDMADEASADDFIREDFDAEVMARADAYAEAYHLPRFDEAGLGLDMALQLADAAHALWDR